MRTRDILTTALATLGSGEFLLAPTKVDANREQGTTIQRVNYSVVREGGAITDGPILFGLCTQLTTAELAEWFDADPQFKGDPDVYDESHRHAKILGAYDHSWAITGTTFGGPWRRGSFPWRIIEGNELSWFWLNGDASALQTGINCRVVLEILGEWLRD